MSDQSNQLNSKLVPPVTTTDAGIPAPSDEYSLAVGPTGPVLLQDNYLIEKMAPVQPRARVSGHASPAVSVWTSTWATSLHGCLARSDRLLLRSGL